MNAAQTKATKEIKALQIKAVSAREEFSKTGTIEAHRAAIDAESEARNAHMAYITGQP